MHLATTNRNPQNRDNNEPEGRKLLSVGQLHDVNRNSESFSFYSAIFPDLFSSCLQDGSISTTLLSALVPTLNQTMVWAENRKNKALTKCASRVSLVWKFKPYWPEMCHIGILSNRELENVILPLLSLPPEKARS